MSFKKQEGKECVDLYEGLSAIANQKFWLYAGWARPNPVEQVLINNPKTLAAELELKDGKKIKTTTYALSIDNKEDIMLGIDSLIEDIFRNKPYKDLVWQRYPITISQNTCRIEGIYKTVLYTRVGFFDPKYTEELLDKYKS